MNHAVVKARDFMARLPPPQDLKPEYCLIGALRGATSNVERRCREGCFPFKSLVEWLGAFARAEVRN